MKVFRRGSFFRIPVEKVRELTVEQQRERRVDELKIELAHVDVQCAGLSARITEFLFEHKGLDGRYRASSLEELGRMPDLELRLRQDEFVLNQRRAKILAELAELSSNPAEASHIAGERVTP